MPTIREDALLRMGRYYVPTSPDTQWVASWAGFREVGGTIHFNEDQTEVRLALPAPHKFSIQFQSEVSEVGATLRQAESFISGFEDDEQQEGIGSLLVALRGLVAQYGEA